MADATAKRTSGQGNGRVRAFSVEAALNEYVQALEEPRPPDGMYHPSSLYGCPRKAVYELRGVPQTNPPDERTRRVFRVGHIFHDFVQTAVEAQIGRMLLRAYREVPISIPSLGVIGHGDLLAQLSEDTWELQEFKTINSNSAKYADLPKADHVGQVTPYLRAIRDHGVPEFDIPPLGDMLSRARITYVTKDDILISEHVVLFTEAKDRELVKRIAALEPHREHTTSLPPRLPLETKKNKVQRNWQCGYCAFATRCWEQDGEEEMIG